VFKFGLEYAESLAFATHCPALVPDDPKKQMIKLESQTIKGPMVSSLLTIQSNSQEPTVVLGASRMGRIPDPSGAKKPDGKRVYVEAPGIRVQEIRFAGADENSTLTGQVPDSEAVEISAAWRVVAEVGFREDFNTGRSTLQVVRITEVWDRPGKCLWKAEAGAVKGPIATMGADGRISKGNAA